MEREYTVRAYTKRGATNMRVPGPTDLDELRGKSVDYYAKWLTVGLREYLFERAGRYAFTGAENFIEQQGEISEDLAVIAGALKARDQEAFKEACAASLRELNFDDDQGAALAKELLKLGAHLRARGMLAVLADKAYRNQPDGRTSSLYELAFEFARDLADLKQPDAANCLQNRRSVS